MVSLNAISAKLQMIATISIFTLLNCTEKVSVKQNLRLCVVGKYCFSKSYGIGPNLRYTEVSWHFPKCGVRRNLHNSITLQTLGILQ